MVNCGSTSVKVAWFAGDVGDEPTWSVHLPATQLGPDRESGIVRLLRESPVPLERVGAVGHRIVHGADRFDQPVRIDPSVEQHIASVAHFAPLHNRAGLDGLHAARRVVGASVAHVAVFDTAFHRTIPPEAAAYGGPRRWIDEGLRRYGFHGISHQHAATTAARLLGRPITDLWLVTCHIGGGCSLAAVAGGRSVDTTMGLTPLDGLVMATRSGSVDPALVLHLIRSGSSADEVEQLLEQGSGLLGLSGVSGDLRDVLAARDSGSGDAELAVGVFIHRLATGVGAMVAALGRLDGVVFTGGIGERSAEVRARVVDRLRPMAVGVDEHLNGAATGDAIISIDGSSVPVLVVTAREEVAIDRAVRELLRGS